MEILKKLLGYLNPANIVKGTREKNFNLRMMHGINRISIFMFLAALIYMLFKFVILK